jgi:adenosyl cobinamide kinase/adenosyl cobinamide phosphate guanylyltransferase
VIVLVLGGTRSGKSETAEKIATEMGRVVTYVATATVGDDGDFAARVARHRARRPATWQTIETDDLPATLTAVVGPVVVDSIGTWVAGVPDFVVDVDALCHACAERDGDTVIVAEEVGLSIHPPTEVGRRFVDVLGECNRRLADIADRVLLVVAGRTLELEAR